ncbi:MAG: hypothetical protein AAF628_06010 [Planctomycetota bacterium]
MHTPLEDVTLRTGETVSASVIRGPDLAWADRLEALLQHKPPFWARQNHAVARRELGLDAHFYVLHRAGVPFAHVLTTEVKGTGLLGHVFTAEVDRRQGAARLLMQRQLAHFRQRGGRALFLRTGFEGPPYRLYAAFGFAGLEPKSGVMALYADDAVAHARDWFAPGPVEIVAPAWPHWPASAPLFVADTPGIARCVARGLLGRAITEGPFLALLQEHEDREARGAAPRARVAVQTATGAVVGLAQAAPDPQWPGACIVDVHVHPAFAAVGAELLDGLHLPEAERDVAYADVGWEWKEGVLTAAGFRRVAVLTAWAAKDAARTGFVDVGVWERRRLS